MHSDVNQKQYSVRTTVNTNTTSCYTTILLKEQLPSSHLFHQLHRTHRPAEILGEKFPHLSGIPLAFYSSARPQLLIGNDNANLGLPLQIKDGRWSEPIATKTRLGWTVLGCLQHSKQPGEYSVVHYNFHTCQCNKDDTLHKLVKDYFDSENAGITEPLTIESDDDIRARKIMESTTTTTGNRFTTGLLWKYDNIDLPDSYSMAKKRLICLEKKM